MHWQQYFHVQINLIEKLENDTALCSLRIYESKKILNNQIHNNPILSFSGEWTMDVNGRFPSDLMYSYNEFHE